MLVNVKVTGGLHYVTATLQIKKEIKYFFLPSTCLIIIETVLFILYYL